MVIWNIYRCSFVANSPFYFPAIVGHFSVVFIDAVLKWKAFLQSRKSIITSPDKHYIPVIAHVSVSLQWTGCWGIKKVFLKYLLRCTGELCVCSVFVCCLFALLWCLDWKCVVPGNYSNIYLHKSVCNASPFHWVIYIIFILFAFGRIRKLLMDLIL